jgi:hypothetical protein
MVVYIRNISIYIIPSPTSPFPSEKMMTTPRIQCAHHIFFVTWRNICQWAKASSLSRMITLRHTTLDRTPLDE